MSLTSSEAPEERTTARPRVIKRYANRKLYDTRDSRYVTLLQIAEYVRGGEEVAIIDNTTKEDLTNVTLAQIVYEEERKSGDRGEDAGRSSPSVGALRNLIQQSGERLMSTLREGPVGKLIARREAGEHEDGDDTVAKAAETGTSAPAEAQAADKAASADKTAAGDKAGPKTEEARRRLLLSPKEALDELQRLADDRIKAVLGTAISSVQQLQAEVQRMQVRIEELEGRLVALKGAEATDPEAGGSKAITAGDTPAADPTKKAD